MHCTAAVWGPLAPALHATCLAAAADGSCYAGCRDGSISCWRQGRDAAGAPSRLEPVALLQGHSHPVVALLPGLHGAVAMHQHAHAAAAAPHQHQQQQQPQPQHCMLSLDAEGWLALWDCSTWTCLDMTRAAPLPTGAKPTLLLMPDRQHVCVIIPATPSLQQEQQTLWQHQQQEAARSPPRSNGSSSTSPATAANLSPMMLVLRWASLALVSAPLVSNLGLVARTSSSITLGGPDAVVAAAVLDTAPALCPTAADSVVLAVMASGWMWAGSLAGSRLGPAWDKPLLAAGATSTAPLTHGCLRVLDGSSSSSSGGGAAVQQHGSAGGSHSADVQLQLLVVQGDGWRLLQCNSFSSSTGLPQQWVQVAGQQGMGSKAAAADGGQLPTGAPQVRFVAASGSQAAADTMDEGSTPGSSTSTTSSSDVDDACDSEGSACSSTTSSRAARHDTKRSRLARSSGPAVRRAAAQQQVPQEQLLGGVLLQQQQQQAVVAVAVWSDQGTQQVWAAPVQPRDGHQPGKHAAVQQAEQHLQPWPLPRSGHPSAVHGSSPAASAGVLAAADPAGTGYVLLSHHHLQHLGSHWPSLAGLEAVLPHRHTGDTQLHACQLLQHGGALAPGTHPASSPQPWSLRVAHGSWKAAWSRAAVCGSSSDSSSSSSSGSNGAHASLADVHVSQQPMAVDDDAASASAAGSRKRPAVDGQEVAADPAGDSAASRSSSSSTAAPGTRPKQPRVASTHAGGARTAAAPALRDVQQQLVTHLLLLGSDAPGVHQLAVLLQSGALLFYDLGLYCVPGAAWHPDACCVGLGHTGRISCTAEVAFRCPQRHLVVAGGDGPPGSHSLSRPVNWSFSEHSAGSSRPAGEAPACQQQQQQAQDHRTLLDGSSSSSGQAGCVLTAADALAPVTGCSARPAQGGSVPLLLTGGRDGGVRAWDLRLGSLGAPWMAVHPHTAPVEALVLPPVGACLPWSCCVLSVCTTGRVALSCLATGTIKATFGGWSLGPPAQLAWSSGRGLIAAGGWDAAGLWHVAVWDAYSGQLDRQLSGGAAHMLMASLAQELTSSMRHLHRVQGQAATSADGSGAISSGSAWHPVPGEPQQDGSASRSSIDASGSLSGQAPRIQLVTHSAGALSVLQSQQPDVLLLDVDVARLAAELEAHSQQQRRQLASRQHLQQQLGGALGPSLRASSFDTDSLVGTPSLRSSRANSLDLSSPWAGGQATADSSSAPGQAAAQQPPLQQQLQQQQGHIGRQRLRLRGRLPQPPAVAAALQALCLLHRWGVEPHVDEQVLQLLLEQGWGSACVPDAAAGSPRPAALPSFAAAAAAAGSGNRAAASELLQLLGPLLQDPAPGSPLLSHAAPCLSQDVLLSGSGAAAVSLPSVPRTPASLGMLLPAAPTLLSSRLLALVAVSKWLMAALSSSQLAAQACSALMAESALHVPELLAASATASEASSFNHAASSNSPRRAPPHASTQPDLLLLASVTLTHPGLLTEAAQVLLAALLRPAAPGSFAVPSALPQAPQQQQQLQQVFTSPGAAAAASCWPPAVLQFALLHHLQQQQPVLGLQQLPLWMPQLVLAAAAAATRPAEVPPELLAAVGAALLDVLLGTAPAASSCIAASWLCRVLRSGFWAVWRPFVDTPAHLMRRLAHLVDRLQAANTDSRSAAAALINQSLSGLLPPGSPPSSGGGTATAAVPAGTSSTGSSSASDFRLLAQQPAAIADPHGSMGRAGSAAQPRRHVEGGLFISAALLGSAGLQGSLSSAASPAAGAAASASASAAAHQQQQHAGGIVSGPALAPVGPSQQAAGSGGTAAVVHVSRRALVVWLRSALDVLAALTLVDPAALLMELSHRLAAPGAEASSSSLGLMFSAIGRVLRRPADRALLLPHLGFAAALAVQALDPSRPALRHATLQPVMALVRDLAASFRQVDVHQGSLQLAVGSTRDLAGGQQGQQHGAPGGVGSGQPPPLVHAPTVAVFDMNGGQRKKVLLLPVLLCQQQQQQQQQASGARQHHASGPFGSAGSLASSSSEGTAVAAAAITAHLPNGISPLWSAAEGVSGPPQGPEQPHARPWSSGDGGGGSSSSLSTSAPSATAAADDAKLQRGELASSTMTRAEAAMVEHWFGGRDAAAADDAPGRHSAAGGSSGGGGGPSLLLQGGVWYTDAATANSAVLAAGDVGGGVAAVAFSPAGDAVAALVLPGHCLVAWRLAASWTQKLATFGTSLPVSQLPAVYIRIPAAATLVSSAFRQQQQQPAGGDGTSGSSSEGDGSREVLQWQLRWQTSTHVDLLHQGYLCGSLEVRL